VPDNPAVRKDNQAQTLRIEAARIDHLLRVTGELVVAKNAIGHIVSLAQEQGGVLAPMLKQGHDTLARLIGELHDSVMSARMLPLRTTFRRFPRLISELSAGLGKPARLVIEGEHTEADRTIAEILVEPLIHVLRNAMVHGIENPEVRAAAGKPKRATIVLRASRQGEHVVLEVCDDGAGIDVAALRYAARGQQVVADAELTAMSDDEVIDLIFSPGFSTATDVTDLSGRGVGMDAARTAVSRIGGQVSVSSVPGAGTTIRFQLPFSVMMTRVITIEASGQTYGIPLDCVIEALRVPTQDVQPVGTAEAVVVRQKTVPLIDLARLLGKSANAVQGDTATIVIASIAGEHSALRVDRVGEPVDVILKPVDGLLAATPGLAGLAVLGDGDVLLVLDLEDLLA
jgi:two-component system chemotaxis sensor kinase CheA